MKVDLTSEFRYQPPRTILYVSVPFISAGGCAGSMKNLPWKVQSPSNTLRASCSLPGLGMSWGRGAAQQSATIATMVFMSFPSLSKDAHFTPVGCDVKKSSSNVSVRLIGALRELFARVGPSKRMKDMLTLLLCAFLQDDLVAGEVKKLAGDMKFTEGPVADG